MRLNASKKTRLQTPLYLVLLALVIAVMYSLKRCQAGQPVIDHDKAGGDTLNVAIEYSPLSLYNYDDTLGGFNYDLLRMIAADHGINVKFHPVVTLSSALNDIDHNVYDLLVTDMAITNDTRDRYLFTDPVYLDRQVLVQHRDSAGNVAIGSQLDLAGDTVWIVEGSPAAGRIANLSREIGDTIYTRTEPLYGAEQLFMMTALGDIKQAVINSRVAAAMAKDYPDVDINTGISFSQFQSWIISKKNEALLDSLNHWLDEAKATPAYNKLLERYNVE